MKEKAVTEKESQCNKSRSAAFRIVHISDIHFGATFDKALWEYVKAIVQREKPDMIISTGDMVDHASLFMLLLAKKEMESITNDAGKRCVFRVVPGNHDVGLFGNLCLWPWKNHFRIVFGIKTGDDISDLLSKLPTYTQYVGLRWYERLLCRLKFTYKLTKLRVSGGLKDPGAESLPIIREDDPDEIFLAYLDSNFAPWLASGNVDVAKVTELQAAVLRLRTNNPKKIFVPRIALLHHHALPIPYSNVREGLTSFEPFLVLRNSGTVVRELCRNDFDLILHGHKHFASFVRLSYANDSDAEGDLAVISAGSASVTHGEAGRNSINLIDIYPNGQIAYLPIFFGGGRSADLATFLSSSKQVHSLSMLKRRAFRRAMECQSQECTLLYRSTEIEPSGTATYLIRHEGVKMRGSATTNHRHFHVSVTIGKITPNSVEFDDDTYHFGYKLTTDPLEPTKKLTCTVDLGQTLTSASDPIAYGVRFRTINNYMMSAWECNEFRQSGAYYTDIQTSFGEEWTSAVIRKPCRRLLMLLELPDTLQDPMPKVRVLRWHSYPDLTFDANEDFVNETGDWELDPVMTAYERPNFDSVGERKWQLEVEYPIVGYRYEIRWRVRNREEEGLYDMAGMATGLKRSLLALTQQSFNSASPSPLTSIYNLLTEALESQRHLLASQHTGQASMAMSIFVYEAETHELKLLVNAGDAELLLCREIPLGEGIGGTAFKRGRPTLYIDPELPGGTREGAYLHAAKDCPEFAAQKPALLVAFPLYHPRATQLKEENRKLLPPHAAVGVLRFATTAFDSRLVESMLPLDHDANQQKRSGSSEQEKAFNKLWALGDLILDFIVDKYLLQSIERDSDED